MADYSEAFERVMAEARSVSRISDFERAELYEPLKTVVYDLLRSGAPESDIVVSAVSWLRQNVQIEQSSKRLSAGIRECHQRDATGGSSIARAEPLLKARQRSKPGTAG